MACIYRIADLHFKCDGISTELQQFCQEFLCESAPKIDYEITLTQGDVDYELARSDEEEREYIKSVMLEGLALYRKICACALSNDAFLMHGAVIEYEGKGYLFTAQSGTGKTTHIRRWRKLFGKEKVTIVNGDKPIIRFIDGKVYAYGTPWRGKEGYGTTDRVELSAICFIERGEENSIKKISDIEALPRIFSQIMIHDSADLGKQMDLVDSLLSSVPTYILKCNMDVEAARVAYEGMNAQEDKK